MLNTKFKNRVLLLKKHENIICIKNYVKTLIKLIKMKMKMKIKNKYTLNFFNLIIYFCNKLINISDLSYLNNYFF